MKIFDIFVSNLKSSHHYGQEKVVINIGNILIYFMLGILEDGTNIFLDISIKRKKY